MKPDPQHFSQVNTSSSVKGQSNFQQQITTARATQAPGSNPRVAPSPHSPTKNSRRDHRNSHEEGMIAETSLKLFFSLLVSLIATISLARLLPYHFAQSGKLAELRAQVKETEYRVKIKRQQLEKNFDFEQTETLREKHSSRISENRVRVFWQKPTH